MTRTRIARLVSTAVLGAVGLTASSLAPAFSSVAQYRYVHGEPLNNLQQTPGATFSVTAATVCRSGYATSVRDVPTSEKTRVYAQYGIAHHVTNQYEVDHLISLELGGSNAITNLWPEPNDHPKGHLNSKDILENRLHALVCNGTVALHVAQHTIATDWVAAYHRYVGGWPTGTTPVSPSATATTVASSASKSVTTTTPTPAANPVTSTTAALTTTTSSGGGVRITALSNPVSPGQTASLTAHSPTANDSCSLSVTLPSGAQSQSSGLGGRSADASGNATWSWKIGTNTGAGTATASVSCGAGSTSASFTVS